jgi:pimeloyl-ACP methyl ester carboxylesterase
MGRVILAAEGVTWLAAIRVPILVVAGTRDRYVDLDLLRALAARHSHVRLRVWAGAGHDLPIEESERCLSAIESRDDPLERRGGPSSRAVR